MKKLVSVVLVLVMVLALGVTAFADTGIYVTKHPTDEVRAAGGTAWFISGATNYNTLSWTFMSPDGTKYSVQDFRTRFPYATVEGEYTTTLTVRNLNTDMNRWGVFCTFTNNNGSTDTAMAFLYVSAYAAQTYSQPASTAPSYSTGSSDNDYVPASLYAVDGFDPSASDSGYVPASLYAVDGFDPSASDSGYVPESLYAADGFDPLA